MQLVTGTLPKRAGFNSGPIFARFVADRMDRIFSEIFSFMLLVSPYKCSILVFILILSLSK